MPQTTRYEGPRGAFPPTNQPPRLSNPIDGLQTKWSEPYVSHHIYHVQNAANNTLAVFHLDLIKGGGLHEVPRAHDEPVQCHQFGAHRCLDLGPDDHHIWRGRRIWWRFQVCIGPLVKLAPIPPVEGRTVGKSCGPTTARWPLTVVQPPDAHALT